jgi:hypothetical protein
MVLEAARKVANPVNSIDIVAEVRRTVGHEFDSVLLWGPLQLILDQYTILGIDSEDTE